MKKILLIFAACVAVAVSVTIARATIVLLTPSSVSIAANTITNFPTSVVVGQFTLSPTYVYFNESGVTNGAVTVSGLLSFDGSNVFRISQLYYFPTNNGQSNATSALWYVTNITFNVYGQISVSNGMSSYITNFSAAVQQ